jgi:transcription elongation factor GreA
MEKEVLLTQEGFEKLEAELEKLKTVKRKEVAERIKQAIAYGDISENSEYDEAKNEQAFIEGRIVTVENMLRNARIIKDEDRQEGKVSLGSKVKVLDLEFDEEITYKIVGSAEADPLEDLISNESPLGSVLLNKAIGEEVDVTAPAGKFRYKILDIVND